MDDQCLLAFRIFKKFWGGRGVKGGYTQRSQIDTCMYNRLTHNMIYNSYSSQKSTFRFLQNYFCFKNDGNFFNLISQSAETNQADTRHV